MKPAPFFFTENRWAYWLSSHERNCPSVQRSFLSCRVCRDVGKFCRLWRCRAGSQSCWDDQFFPSSGHMAGWVDMTASVSRCVCRLGPLPFSDKLTAFASRLLPYIQTFKFQTSKMQMCIPSPSGLSETAACPPSPIGDDPSALPSPTSSATSSNSCLFTRCQPLYTSCWNCTTVFFKVLGCKIKNIFFIFCVCFLWLSVWKVL